MPKFTFFAALLIVGSNLFAQEAPKYSNEFLSLGVGSRELALGGTGTAFSNDVTAGYWNPSLLLNIEPDQQIALMHAQYFNGIANYDYLSYSLRLDTTSRLGVSLIRFGVDDIPDTRFLFDANGNIDYSNVGSFAAADYALLVSYAKKTNILGGLSIGGNAKVIHRSVGVFANAWGFGIDLGAHLTKNKITYGVMLHDITGTFTAWDLNEEELAPIYDQTGNESPEDDWEITLPRLSIGASRQFVINDDWDVLTSLDLITTFDGRRNTLLQTDFLSVDPRFGTEVGFKDMAFLRVGASTFQEVSDISGEKSWTFSPSAGVGVVINNFTVDYAYTNTGKIAQALYSHIFTVKFDWNSLNE